MTSSSIRPSQWRRARSMPEDISSATAEMKSGLTALLAIWNSQGHLLRRSGRGGRRRPFDALALLGCSGQAPPTYPHKLLLVCWSGLIALFLHMFLHTLLVLGHHVGDFGLLVGAQQVVHLRGDLGMLDLELHTSLRRLRGDGCSLGLVKVAAGDELHHLLVRLKFLLHERLHGRVLGFHDLVDLSFLVVSEIELVQWKSEAFSEAVVHHHAVMHGTAFASLVCSNSRTCE